MVCNGPGLTLLRAIWYVPTTNCSDWYDISHTIDKQMASDWPSTWHNRMHGITEAVKLYATDAQQDLYRQRRRSRSTALPRSQPAENKPPMKRRRRRRWRWRKRSNGHHKRRKKRKGDENEDAEKEEGEQGKQANSSEFYPFRVYV